MINDTDMEIVGAAAIRSLGFGEHITINNCEFHNQTTTHLSSCIWFVGRGLVIKSNYNLQNLKIKFFLLIS